MFVGTAPLLSTQNTEILELLATPTTNHFLPPPTLPITSTDIDQDDPVTIYTQAASTDTHPTFELIVPTITTNSFPSGYAPINISSAYSHNNYNSNSNYYSNYNYNSTYQISGKSSLYLSRISSQSLIPIYSDPEYPSSTTTSSLIKSFKTSLKPSRSFYITTSTTSSSSSSSSSSSLSSSKSTKTVTEFLEDVTYTQVYVVTDSQTTITTSLLATTTFYVDSLSSTYIISPPAITTDINALKSRPDFFMLSSNHGLSHGSIAGIVIALVFGLGFVSLLLYYLFKKNPFWEKHNFINFIIGSHKDSPDNIYSEKSMAPNSKTFENPMIILSQSDLNSNESFQTPPLINRNNKPNIFNSPEKQLKPLDINNANNTNNINDDDLDMSLFDMHTAFSEINSSTKNNNYILPPIPESRKNSNSNSINSINTMNYQEIASSPKTPLNLKLPIDRTMGVLYESPNEQCVWDEFSTAKDSGMLNPNLNNNKNNQNFNSIDSPINSIFNSPLYSPANSPSGSPLRSTFDNENLNFNNNNNTNNNSNRNSKSTHYMQQLNINNDYDDSLRANILSSNRVRSGSGATRYDYIANSVNTFKFELEKERLASPLKTNFDLNELDDYDDVSDPLKLPPPVPQPRKNVH